ncbi:Acetyltransferase, GNAT family [uncultured Desulfobacterium sp.]|uniref:Acetyltransferase, GNAT family n=1 Tax=uncultured Desulfobacterium sp. TaxID=201089 RepID=A0A445N3W6_9BACT|nr:Acetyltransferase, GNAT family [uncultured Desulfobacterium sp.]
MPKIDPQELQIRIMKKGDIDAIVNIDASVFGEKRTDYYERKCALALDQSNQMVTSLVAEYKGKIIGFIMSNTYLGEFGIPEPTASLDTIGVDPEYQKQGVALALMKQFIANAKKAHIEDIYALVNWNDWDMLKFFERSGFVPSKAIKLELKL